MRFATTRDLRRRTPPFSCRKLKRRGGVGCRLLAAREHYIVVHLVFPLNQSSRQVFHDVAA
jgi:hypothetical protein